MLHRRNEETISSNCTIVIKTKNKMKEPIKIM